MTQSILWGQVGLMVGVVFCTLRFLLELKFTWHHVSHNLVGDHQIFHEPCLEPWKRDIWHCYNEKRSNNTLGIDEKSEGHPQNFLLSLQFFWNWITKKLLTCSYPHHCPGEQSQNGQEIPDHPSLLQLYRYSTEEKYKLENIKRTGYT